MKRYLLAALVVLTVTPGVASSQMMGGGMSSGGAAHPCEAQKEAAPKMPAPEMGGGMMGQGMMSGMMGQCKEMMGGGMMGPEKGSMMPSMMEGMMPAKTRGCMMMAEGMMKGQMDMARMHKALALSDEQTERLRAGVRPFQREAILTLASMKVAELELADLLAVEKADFGKVEAKLKEIEAMRTKVRLAHFKAADAVKSGLSKEQLEKLQGAVESSPASAPPADAGHEQHH